jgi:hypothetical protein
MQKPCYKWEPFLNREPRISGWPDGSSCPDAPYSQCPSDPKVGKQDSSRQTRRSGCRNQPRTFSETRVQMSFMFFRLLSTLRLALLTLHAQWKAPPPPQRSTLTRKDQRLAKISLASRAPLLPLSLPPPSSAPICRASSAALATSWCVPQISG